MSMKLLSGSAGAGIGLVGGGLAWALEAHRWIGWVVVAAGVLLMLWSVRIHEKHLWQRWWGTEHRGSRFDMTLNALVRRVAFESRWAAAVDWDNPVDRWQEKFWWKPLKKEVFKPLVSGELEARGILHRRSGGDDNGPTLIPTEFWRQADFYPELMLTEPSINSARNGSLGHIYEDIEVVVEQVEGLWPTRSKREIRNSPSPFVAWHQEWWAEQEATRLNTQREMEEQVERAKRARELDR